MTNPSRSHFKFTIKSNTSPCQIYEYEIQQVKFVVDVCSWKSLLGTENVTLCNIISLKFVDRFSLFLGIYMLAHHKNVLPALVLTQRLA